MKYLRSQVELTAELKANKVSDQGEKQAIEEVSYQKNIFKKIVRGLLDRFNLIFLKNQNL